MILADDILKALTDSYSSATSNIDNDKQTVNQTVGRTVATKRMKEYAEELKNIKDIRKAEADRYKELYKAELNAQKYSQKVKADLLKQEISHYTSLYNLNNDLHKKQTALLEAERNVYKNINDNGKITLKNQSELYSLKLKEQQLEKQTAEYKIKKFEENVNKIKKGFETVVSHVFKRIDELNNIKVWDNWIKGISDLQTQYESNFTEMSGRLGVSSGIDTHNLIGNVLDDVKSNDIYMKGLNFNNEVFPQIADAVKRGFQGEKAEEIGLSTAIDKKIMPWLDTKSDTWTDLQYNLDDRLLNQLKGQQLQLQATQEGNRILQNGVASQITDSLAPTLLNIDANTTDVSALSGQAQAMVSSLMDNGYSKQDAIKMANQVIDAYQNPFKALTSGSTADKLYALGGLQGGDIASSLNFADKFLQTGANGNWATSAAYANLGFITNGQTRTTDWILDHGKATEAANKYTGSDFEGTYNDKVNNLTEYVTATQKNDNEKQNESVIKYFNDAFGNHKLDIDKMILEEIKSIKSWLITGLIAGFVSQLGSKVIDKIASNLGSGSKGTSLVSNLFTGGSGLKKAIEYGSEAYTGKMSAGTGLQYGGLVGGLTQGGATMTGLSGGAATLAGAGTVLAGGMLTKKGISTLGEAANYNEEIDYTNKGNGMNIGTGLAMAGGGGMAIAAGLGLASGPIGWAGLLIGGGAYLAKAAYDNAYALTGSAEMVRQQSEETKDAINTENLERMTSARKLKENVDNSTSLTDKQNLIVQEGLASESEARKLNATEIDNLTQSYMSASKDIQSSSKTLINAINQDVVKYTNKNSKQILDDISNKVVAEKFSKGDNVEVDSDVYQALELLMAGVTDENVINNWNDYIKDGKLTYHEAYKMLYGSNIFSKDKLYGVNISSDALKDVQTYTKYGKDADIRDFNEQYVNVLNDINNKYTEYKHTSTSSIKEKLKNEIVDEYNKWIEDKDFTYFIRNVSDNSRTKLNIIADEFNLQKYRLGSTYIPYDSFALLHAGERILTANQNKEYTKELQTGNGSIIVNSIQDVVSAIQNQTKTIIDYLSTMNFNNSSGFKKLNNLPTMGNTKITW